MKNNIVNRLIAGTTFLLLFVLQPAMADDWTMHITVDNQYDVYFGAALSTTSFVGGDGDWTTVETYTGTGLNPNTDYLYVATASDFMGLQGFLAEFQNNTQSLSIPTGTASWEVFPAGQYLQQIDPGFPAVWPARRMPTQAEVDLAIAFAETNTLWVSPGLGPGFTNISSNNPWGRTFPSIPTNADFIWHDTGRDSNSRAPFDAFNHDEFLVFRVSPVPEPNTGLLAMVCFAAMGLIRRCR